MTFSRKKSRLNITPLCWNDLPQDILCLILQSKRLLFSDRIRFRAVCRSWRLPKNDEIIKSSEYPWLIRLRCFVVDAINYSFKFNMIEPHYWKVHTISKSIEKSSYKSLIHDPLHTTYTTKYGWMLYGTTQQGQVWSFFFLNPFSNHHIVLPPLSFSCNVEHNVCVAATFTAIPTFLDSCEVLVLFRTIKDQTYYIGRYKYNRKDGDDKSDSWTTQLLGRYETSYVSVHYMDGKLYCYFHRLGVLKSYSLADKTWELVSSNPPLSTESYFIDDSWILFSSVNSSIWLTQIRSSLAMVVWLVSGPKYNIEGEVVEQNEWMIFKFDWSWNKWIDIGKDLKNIALFVCQETIFSLPIEEDDCLIFHRDTSDTSCRNKISCYSLKQKKNISQPQEPYPSLNSYWDFSIRFVEPPFLV